jgi:hypothetical protein
MGHLPTTCPSISAQYTTIICTKVIITITFMPVLMKDFVLCTLLFCWCSPFLCSTERLWVTEPLTGLINSIDYEELHLCAEFETTVPVSIACDYPCLKGTIPLLNHVNKKLEMATYKQFEHFVEQEMSAQDDLTQDFGGCELSYAFYPIYYSTSLVSIFGCEFQHRACPHGWTHYEGRNFWQKGDSIIEIAIADLFIKESNWCNYLLQYCDRYFRSLNYGYYGQRLNFNPELIPEHLNAFLITDKGITIIFPSYVVGGWADGPDIISIPYRDLKAFIDPMGPLKNIAEIL